jgi:hypothetical protein
MPKPPPPHAWQSPLGPLIAQFIQEKQACGYTYATEQGTLRRLDRFLDAHGLAQIALPRSLVEPWIAKHAPNRPYPLVGCSAVWRDLPARPGYPTPVLRLIPRTQRPSSFTLS